MGSGITNPGPLGRRRRFPRAHARSCHPNTAPAPIYCGPWQRQGVTRLALVTMPALLSPLPLIPYPTQESLKNVFPGRGGMGGHGQGSPTAVPERRERLVPAADSWGSCTLLQYRRRAEEKFEGPRVPPSRHSCCRRPGLPAVPSRSGFPGPPPRGAAAPRGCQQAAAGRHCQHNTRLCFPPVC